MLCQQVFERRPSALPPGLQRFGILERAPMLAAVMRMAIATSLPLRMSAGFSQQCTANCLHNLRFYTQKTAE
jgi:hypothetical protein